MKDLSRKPQNLAKRQADEVVLCRWRKGGDIIALFPELPATSDGLVNSYRQVGQHGTAEYKYVISQTAPVPLNRPDQEREELLGELSSMGYNPAARIRRPNRWRKRQSERRGVSMKDLVDRIIDYESGLMGEQEAVDFFQELVDSGLAWTLQGHYGRTASQLIDAGLVKPRTRKRGK